MARGAAFPVGGDGEHFVTGGVKGLRKRLDALGEDPVVVRYKYLFIF